MLADPVTRSLDGPIEIADRVWWVGSLRSDDMFQCHSYLVEAGDNSVLIDPGSRITIDETLRRVSSVVPLSSVRWAVCHHSDPDIAGGLPALRRRLPSPELRVVTEWRAEALLRHYDAGIPFHRVEDHDWAIGLGEGRCLRFVLTPYLHFPGAMCSFDDSTGVLFSSDLFGGFTSGERLFADEAYFESMRPFHEHYMPSREILAAGLGRIRRAFDPIRMVAPQHGCVIPERLVDETFERLANLECGIFLLAQNDLDVSRLLQVAAVLRRITDALVMAHGLAELATVAERVLPDVLPVASVELFVHSPHEGLLRFSSDDGFAGTPCAPTEPSSTRIVVPIPGGGPDAEVAIALTVPADVSAELDDMFARLAPLLRVALNRHLEQRAIEHQQVELRETASHDALTGLYNRHALASLASVEDEYGLLMIDVDHFKRVNDEYGHTAGDLVLKSVAGCVKASIREHDAAIRYGGEEILAVLPATEPATVEAVAERIRLQVGRLTFDGAPELHVTVSIGAATHRSMQTVSAAIEDADHSLYRAKTAGRNQVEVSWREAERARSSA